MVLNTCVSPSDQQVFSETTQSMTRQTIRGKQQKRLTFTHDISFHTLDSIPQRIDPACDFFCELLPAIFPSPVCVLPPFNIFLLLLS